MQAGAEGVVRRVDHLLDDRGVAGSAGRRTETRSLEESLSRAWKVLATLPRDQLTMLPARFLDAYYPAGGDR